ncbi:MAG: carbohydrate kinase, partial [Spirochaetales bacterium]|nr:carbohydrate kinase [Spirochaetales bacterium]
MNDITMIGHISRDIMIYKGDEVRLTGGPVIYSSAAAARSGKKIQVITRASKDAESELDGMRSDGVQVIRLDSGATTSIENIYFSADKEKRKVTLL